MGKTWYSADSGFGALKVGFGKIQAIIMLMALGSRVIQIFSRLRVLKLAMILGWRSHKQIYTDSLKG